MEQQMSDDEAMSIIESVGGGSDESTPFGEAVAAVRSSLCGMAQVHERYVLWQDNDAHWYVCPAEKVLEADAWLNTEDAQSGVVPDYLQQIGGSPRLVSFCDPIIR